MSFLSLAVETPGGSGTSQERTGRSLEAGSQREGTSCQMEGRSHLIKGLMPSFSSTADSGGILTSVKQSLQFSLYLRSHNFSGPAYRL